MADNVTNNDPNIRIGIDGNEANVLQRVGSNVYAFELLVALYNWLEQTRQFQVVVYTNGPRHAQWPPETTWWQYQEVSPAKFSTVWKLPWELRGNPDNLDLWYSPGHYLPLWSPVPTINTVMDLAYEQYPEQFTTKDLWQLRLLTQASVRQAQHVCAISQATRDDIVSYYGRAVKDISVIYPAAPEAAPLSQKSAQTELQKLEIEKPFVLYMGTLQPRKNITRLIHAFEKIAVQNPDLQLVLAGKTGWKSEGILHAVEHSSVRDRVVMTGFVSQTQKIALLQEAQATVLVGLYEGFGLPPLEAIRLGGVPVVSNLSSLPEVVGPTGITVDPHSVNAIAAAIQEVLSFTPVQRKKHVHDLQKHAKQFQWRVSAQELGTLLWQEATRVHVL